jgi:CHAT domain-containing protein/tetratricopeptide (TPR) repeat protein
MKYCLSLGFLWFFLAKTQAQSDSIRAELSITKALVCIENNNTDSAFLFYNDALTGFQKIDNLTCWKTCHIQFALAQAEHTKPFQAIEIFENAQRNQWRMPQNLPEWQKTVALLLNEGYVAEVFVGDYAKTQVLYEQAYSLYQDKLNEHDDRVARYLYHKLAAIYSRLGDYDRAITLLRKGIAYAERYQYPDAANFGDLMIALQCADRRKEALAVAEMGKKMAGLPQNNLFIVFLNEADIHREQGNFTAAMTALGFAGNLLDSLADNQEYYAGDFHKIKATLLRDQKDYPQAVASAKLAMQVSLNYFGNTNRREFADLNNLIGETFLQAGQPDSALAYFHTALRCVARNFDSKSQEDEPNPAFFYAENKILEALEGKARAFAALKQPENALRCYELIPEVEAKLRETYQYETASFGLLRESRLRLETAVKTAYTCYAKTGDPVFMEKAFRFTELARGLMLSQNLAAARANFQLPEAMRKRENDLRTRDAWLEQQIFEEKQKGTKSTLATLENQQLQLKREREIFQAERKKGYPDYERIANETPIVDALEVSALLRPKQALLDFFVAGDTIYTFAFLGGGVPTAFRETVLPEGFSLDLSAFREFLAQPNDAESAWQSFVELSAQLYKTLLYPILDADPIAVAGLQSLLIVPDLGLSFIPFEVLLRHKPTVTNGLGGGNLPYLLHDYNVGYAVSATLLRLQQQQSAQREKVAPSFFGGFAPTYSSMALVTRGVEKLENERLPLEDVLTAHDTTSKAVLEHYFREGDFELPGARREVLAAAQIFEGQAFLDIDADESRFKVEASRFRILHLAMHALTDDRNPAFSFLLFGDKNPDAQDDNRLYVNELSNMHLLADLAVLSACKTGSGKYAKGEGVLSIARAFALAGVPATVMSLWKLPDEATPDIIEGFYKNLKAGETKDTALRRTKLDYLAKTRNRTRLHPFYWSGLVAGGDLRVF